MSARMSSSSSAPTGYQRIVSKNRSSHGVPGSNGLCRACVSQTWMVRPTNW